MNLKAKKPTFKVKTRSWKRRKGEWKGLRSSWARAEDAPAGTEAHRGPPSHLQHIPSGEVNRSIHHVDRRKGCKKNHFSYPTLKCESAIITFKMHEKPLCCLKSRKPSISSINTSKGNFRHFLQECFFQLRHAE